MAAAHLAAWTGPEANALCGAALGKSFAPVGVQNSWQDRDVSAILSRPAGS
jgi:hypothetical protein